MSAHRHIVRPRKTLLLLLRQMSPPRQGRRERLFAVCIDPDMENGRKVTPDQLGGEMAGKGWMVVTGGGEGIMEAAHVGAGQDLAMGINILLPFEQSANRIIASDPKLIHVKYFFTRKLLFVKESSGVALFPGGFGTLDEAFEVLTILQTGKGALFPIVLLDGPGGDYWRLWKEFVAGRMVRRQLIFPRGPPIFLGSAERVGVSDG